jgi:hypothetical protein
VPRLRHHHRTSCSRLHFAQFNNGLPVRYPAGELAYAAPVAGEEAFCPACNTTWVVVAEPAAGEDPSASNDDEKVAAARMRFYERLAALPTGAAKQALFWIDRYGPVPAPSARGESAFGIQLQSGIPRGA